MMMPDTEIGDSQMNAIDRKLKHYMPMRVLRRLLLATWLMIIVLGIVLFHRGDQVDTNANKSADAVCVITKFAYDLAVNSRTPEGRKILLKLGDDMRALVTRCAPPPAELRSSR